MKGIELCLRFSYITNRLRYCGPEEANKAFLEYLDNKDNEDQVKEMLGRFEGLLPYLSTIAEKHNKQPFDFDVVEAYWIGNSLLENFNKEEMKQLIDKLMERGLPKSIGEKVKENIPNKSFPHHSFNVYIVGVGNLTGSVEATKENMEKCRISSAEVMKIENNNNKLFVKTETGEKEIDFMPLMLPEIKVGDIVAIHWDFAPLILTNNQVKNLKKYSIKN
ncbi:MAG: DUF6390 family protein [Candidatus Woesearchaeota archaeon]